MLASSSLVRLILLLPATREHIVQRILKGATVHVDQAFLFPGFGVADDRDKTQVPSQRLAYVNSR